MPFLIGSRGKRLGEPLGERQAHRVFNALRDDLGWVNRGAHAAPRLHDLRHTIVILAKRSVTNWKREDDLEIARALSAARMTSAAEKAKKECRNILHIGKFLEDSADMPF
ncbi:hypothetical protein [Dechloromonas sp. ZS-1]|uniref:hypothetical protein n=1 Tax=Dechloromonas sp. ZS-1 TaxID=3138067 RepID=UPI0031FCC4CD